MAKMHNHPFNVAEKANELKLEIAVINGLYLAL